MAVSENNLTGGPDGVFDMCWYLIAAEVGHRQTGTRQSRWKLQNYAKLHTKRIGNDPARNSDQYYVNDINNDRNSNP